MSDFLYPFLSGDSGGDVALTDDLRRSALEKISISASLRASTLAASAPTLEAAADDLAARFRAGGQLFVFGNGGSSTDAGGLASLFGRPPSGQPLPARSLTDDAAVLTALGNDVGYDLVFSRQLIAFGRSDDVAVGFSTSGNSRNLLAAFAEARSRGMSSVGFAGAGGGAMATAGTIDHLFLVDSPSVHRIQECHASLGFALWQRTIDRLGVST